jgi:hypothetical protein
VIFLQCSGKLRRASVRAASAGGGIWVRVRVRAWVCVLATRSRKARLCGNPHGQLMNVHDLIFILCMATFTWILEKVEA